MIFISGGVRSGKSAFAETCAQSLAERYQQPLVYAATAVAFDEEMQQRIQRHQYDRAMHQWQTIEVPYHLQPLYDVDGIILLECVTTWVSNILYKYPTTWHHYIEQFKTLCLHKKETLIIVSNELLHEVPSKYAETEQYRQILGKLHQWLVQESDAAYACTFGHIHQWKGAPTCKDFC